MTTDCPIHGAVATGMRHGMRVATCAVCGWPHTPREISIGQAIKEADAGAYQRRASDVGCDCGLDGRTCADDCGCACHWVAVH